jgi:hypothetical protein
MIEFFGKFFQVLQKVENREEREDFLVSGCTFSASFDCICYRRGRKNVADRMIRFFASRWGIISVGAAIGMQEPNKKPPSLQPPEIAYLRTNCSLSMARNRINQCKQIFDAPAVLRRRQIYFCACITRSDLSIASAKVLRLLVAG